MAITLLVWLLLFYFCSDKPGWFVVARITRRVGVTFRVASRGAFIKDFSKEGPTFALTSPNYSVKIGL